MTVEKFIKEIQKQIENQIFFIHGSEAYLIDVALDALKNALNLNNMNFDVREEFDIDGLITLCEQVPCFSDYRAVVLKNAALFNKGSADELIAYMKEMPRTTKLIYTYFGEADKRRALTKYLLTNAVDIEAGINSPTEIQKWILATLKRKGVRINKEDAGFLIEVSGPDMYALAGEMEKLAMLGKKEISADDIEKLASKSPAYNIFMLHTYMLHGNYERAFGLVKEIFLKEKTYIPLISLLCDKFHNMYMAKGCMDAGLNLSGAVEVMKKSSKLNSGAAAHAYRECEKFSIEELKQAIMLLSKYEFLLKTGGPDEGIEAVLTKIYMK
jgi:DNA polymerase III delta subunit